MNCSSHDWKAYLLGELPESERLSAHEHASACQACSEEVERLRWTTNALRALPEEEPPRRIAFVSDKVFEPNWWQRFWGSAPRLGFASAALLAAAILVHAFTRPVPVLTTQAIDPAAVEARVEREVTRRLEAAVSKAVADSEQRQRQITAEMVRAVEKRMAFDRRADLVAMAENFEVLRKRMNVMLTANVEPGGVR